MCKSEVEPAPAPAAIERYTVDVHIPKGSGDAEYRIVDATTGAIVALIDPNMALPEPFEIAAVIAVALNREPPAPACAVWCAFCSEPHAAEHEDESNSTWQQWQCQCCDKWNDRTEC